MNFEAFNLDPRILANVKTAGYKVPTPIQTVTIPEIMLGRDILGLAQTGTGKTAAFVLPILHRMLGGPRRKIRTLILSPTRELAEQTRNAIKEFTKDTNLKSMTIYGGVNINPQKKKLETGVDIVVACPGRLLDHVGQGTVDLSAVEYLVIDEADHMFDLGFLPDLKRVLKHIPKQRQTLLFSATMPDDIRKLANDVMTKHVTAQIDLAKPAETVSHSLYPVEAHLKTPLLIGLLSNTDTNSVLVFTRTRARSKRVSEQLIRAGFNVATLQGSMPQSKRQQAIDGFRDGKYQILVATDIAARGVDILSISHVINYDMPDTPDAYTHRIGRTGRAKQTGKAFTLITQDDAATVRAFEKVMDIELVCHELEGFDYNVPAPPRQSTSTPHRRTGSGGGPNRNSQSRRPQSASGNDRPRRATPGR